MVKSKSGFLQMQVESSRGYSVELLQPAFSITPERFNAIDMVLAPSKLIGTVIHSKVFIKTYVYQSIIATPTVRVDHRIGCYMPPYYRLQCGFGTVWYDLGIDSAVSFQQSKYNRLAIGATTTLTSDTARAKVRFINFNRTLERRLLFTRSSDLRSQFQVDAINRAHGDTRQCRRNCGSQIHGKTAQKLPEFLFADSGTTVVPIFSIHLKKLTHFNKRLTS